MNIISILASSDYHDSHADNKIKLLKVYNSINTNNKSRNTLWGKKLRQQL